MINSPATSVTRLRLHRSAVGGRIVLRRENFHRAILDFCNNICHNPTYAVQQTGALLDHLVREREQHRWYFETERLGGLEVDDQLNPSRLHYR
jgi:hypothetical protein